jgi:hypothetical protein
VQVDHVFTLPLHRGRETRVPGMRANRTGGGGVVTAGVW